MIALLALVVFSLVAGNAQATHWFAGFMRDAAENLAVNVVANAGTCHLQGGFYRDANRNLCVNIQAGGVASPTPSPAPPTIVQTAQSANATNATATATFASAPASGDLIVVVASMFGNACQQNMTAAGRLVQVTTTWGGGANNACIFLTNGDGATTAYSVAGSANGNNIFCFDVAGAHGWYFDDGLTRDQASPVKLPPLYVPTNALVLYGIPSDNTLPVIGPPAGWTAATVGGQHSISVIYKLSPPAGFTQPSITMTNTAGGNVVNAWGWVY